MEIDKLINSCLAARDKAYVPYSSFRVGAAILLEHGEIISAANIENASYPLCMCAERNALYQAYNMGYKKEDIKAIAISSYSDNFTSPCGACRQVMSELMDENSIVYFLNNKGDFEQYQVRQLLPFRFKKEDME